MFTGKDVGPLSDTEHNMIPDRKSNQVRIEAQLLHRVCSESLYPLGTCLPSRLQAKTEDILAHHLDVRRRHGDVLGGDVHVAEAALNIRSTASAALWAAWALARRLRALRSSLSASHQ